MLSQISVNFGNILLVFSDALDLASPALSQHQQRTAYISLKLARMAHLSTERLENIFSAAILHDIGALSPDEKISIHDSKVHTTEILDTEKHCILGEVLFNQLDWLKNAAPIVRNHHKAWNTYEVPLESPNVLESQIVLLSDILERHIDRKDYILHQVSRITSTISSFAGNLIHPQVVEYFLKASVSEAFWLDLTSPKLGSMLLNEFPGKNLEIDLDGIFALSELVRNIIDFRSHFTACHSSGVAVCASQLARLLSFAETEVTLMEVAGYMHDIGKLSVSNSILNKPGKLTDDEFAIMRQHTYWTYRILSNIEGLEHIAEWAAFHHEKADGTGYPFHITSKDLSLGSRILKVADVFSAIAEDRPYRAGMPKDKVFEVMNGMVSRDHLDKNVVRTLFENYDEVLDIVQKKQIASRKYYQETFAIYE